MKFVFALAIVALYVALMGARPNVEVHQRALRHAVHKGNGEHKHRMGQGKLAEKIRKVSASEEEDEEAEIAEETGEAANNIRKRRSAENGTVRKVSASEEEDEEAEKAEETGEANARMKRAAIDPGTELWPSNRIEYKFEPAVYANHLDKHGKSVGKLTAEAVEEWNLKSGLNITKNPNCDSTECIVVKNGVGCWSYIGYQTSGKNQVVLSDNLCFKKGVILHEFGHALGLKHENKRNVAGNLLSIAINNVEDGMEDQFTLTDDKDGTEYDFCSIMHYGPKAFSKNDDTTITVKNSRDRNDAGCMGSQQGLTVNDGLFVAELYNVTVDKAGCENAGYKLNGGDVCVCSNLFEGDTCEDLKDQSEGCGTVEWHDGVAQFKTPNYPNSYNPGTKCKWIIEQDTQYDNSESVSLCLGFPHGSVTEEAAETNSGDKLCYYAYIEVYDSPKLTYRTVRTCGEEPPSAHAYPLRMQDTGEYWAAVSFSTLEDTYEEKGFLAFAKFIQGANPQEMCNELLQTYSESPNSDEPIAPNNVAVSDSEETSSIITFMNEGEIQDYCDSYFEELNFAAAGECYDYMTEYFF